MFTTIDIPSSSPTEQHNNYNNSSSSFDMSTERAGDLGTVRILVVGDSGVGKSSLVHQLCHSTELQNPNWTIGCSTDVKIFHSQQAGKPYFLEFWDVSGQRKFKLSREFFYQQINGEKNTRVSKIHSVS